MKMLKVEEIYLAGHEIRRSGSETAILHRRYLQRAALLIIGFTSQAINPIKLWFNFFPAIWQICKVKYFFLFNDQCVHWLFWKIIQSNLPS